MLKLKNWLVLFFILFIEIIIYAKVFNFKHELFVPVIIVPLIVVGISIGLQRNKKDKNGKQ